MSHSEAIPKWQYRRAAFNHSWLKNLYIHRLQDCRDKLEKEKPDAVRILRFLREDFPQWRQKQPEIKWLIEQFENEMSPRVLFSLAPLSSISRQAKEWLPGVIHQFWRRENGIEHKIKELQTAFTQVQNLYDEIDVLIVNQNVETLINSSELRNKINKYLRECVKLSGILSLFPRKILFA